MKRGVFLLVLDFVDERENIKDVKKRFKKKKKLKSERDFKRYSVNVNGKNAIVLELTEKDLHSEDVLTLLKIYKGRVLVSSKYANNELLNEYVFSPKEYYQRALLSSLINQIKTVNRDWKNICIKIKSFSPFKELYELVRISKTVTMITPDNALTDKFLKECYYEYGTVVSFKNEITAQRYDVFLDLDEVDNKGKLMINVNGKEFLLYSDTRYFENCSEYQKLFPFNMEHNIICAAFSLK